MSPIAPIDPTVAGAAGGGWQIASVPDLSAAESAIPGVAETEGAGRESFGQLLANQLDNLSGLQQTATVEAAALADGTATDPLAAIQAVSKAQLAMQFASTLRTRGIESVQEIFRTQI